MGGFSTQKEKNEVIGVDSQRNTFSSGTSAFRFLVERMSNLKNIATTNNTDNTDDAPYKSNGFLLHPELNFKDKMISIMVRTMLPYQKVYTTPISNAINDESMKGVKEFRDAVNRGKKEYEAYLEKMSDEFDWGHIKTTFPRQSDILSKWNILKTHTDDVIVPKEGVFIESDENYDTSETVKVIIHGPSTLLDMEHGALRVDEMERRSIPIIIYFHGGGMIAGSAEDSWPLNFAEQLLNCQKNKKGDKDRKEMIVISVDYGLSPEYPFPYPVVDGLSVIEHVLHTFPSNCSFHIAGVSAGGNLAAVTTMETIRYAPGRLRSSFIMHPMLDPMANTQTYHTNDEGSMLSSRWMHWCWKAYLNVDTATANNSENATKLCKNKTHAHTMKSKCKWLNDDSLPQAMVWKRLINPAFDLPSKNALSKTSIIITAARGDILFREGFDFAQKCLQLQEEWRDGTPSAASSNEETTLEKGGNDPPRVTYIETPGDHALALETNPPMKESVVKKWTQAIFA